MSQPTRREFLRHTGSCAAHLAVVAAGLPPALRGRWTSPTFGRVVAAEPFGRLEAIGPNVWALVSTPLGGDFTTVSNGGIVAGRSGVLVVEGLMQPAGATWLAKQARELTGRWPTHAVVTHYHSDHVNGIAGYADGGPAPALYATASTRDLARDKNLPAVPERTARLADAVILDPATPTTLDLGGRSVRLQPSGGHTASDLVLTLEEPAVIFGGDLVWNGMFPNYMDAVPTKLATSVRALRKAGDKALFVPGHGPLGRVAELDRYLEVLDAVETAARAAHQKGQTAAEASAGYRLPASLGEWTLFSPRFMETAFAAWYRELAG
jgi:glyoxylase-like metal-dependent hydrolase (beta-lactamase superfamily II)